MGGGGGSLESCATWLSKFDVKSPQAIPRCRQLGRLPAQTIRLTTQPPAVIRLPTYSYSLGGPKDPFALGVSDINDIEHDKHRQLRSEREEFYKYNARGRGSPSLPLLLTSGTLASVSC